MPSLSILRYPGGKRWFIPYAERFVSKGQRPRVFIEPFAGGATVSLTLLSNNLVDEIRLVEIDNRVSAFWEQATSHPEFADKVRAFDCTRENVEQVVNNPSSDLGFWTLVKNRCSYGGLLDGGLLQKGGKKGGVYQGVKSRWNSEALYENLRAIYALRHRISVVQGDGIEVLDTLKDEEGCVAFIDPPYSLTKASKGSEIYKHHALNHDKLFSVMASWRGRWVATYDNQPEVKQLAESHLLSYCLVPMRNTNHNLMDEVVISRPDDIEVIEGLKQDLMRRRQKTPNA